MRVLLQPIRIARSWGYFTGSWNVILTNIIENNVIILESCSLHSIIEITVIRCAAHTDNLVIINQKATLKSNMVEAT